MQSILNLTNTTKLILAAFVFLAVFVFGSGRANAATLNVTGGCTLPIAIDSVNAGANQSGCTATGASYGTSDTITIPAGTITLSADLPAIVNKSVSIIGVGKGMTIVDADGHTGFLADPDPGPQATLDHVFRNFTITGASIAGIAALSSANVTIDNVEVDNSAMGVYIQATHVIVSNSTISDNVNTTFPGMMPDSDFNSYMAGLGIALQPVDPSDIPSIDITDSVITGNSSESAGILAFLPYETDTDNVDSLEFHMARTTVSGNSGEKWAGVVISEYSGTIAEVGTDLTLDAVTISGNEVNVVNAEPMGNPLESQPYVSGFIFNGRIASARNFTNVTAAYNTITNNVDDRLTGAGFTSSLPIDSAVLTFTNATIVGNETTQSQPSTFFQNFIVGNNPTFFVNRVDPFAPDMVNGSSAQNSLIAGNSRNGVIGSCVKGDKSVLGLSGLLDLTPSDLGNNITDDPNCSGYTVVPNVMSTLGPLQDNGGSVDTIALLDGSPAIKAGASVLGVSTDARGVARNSCPSVGAYQFEGVVCAATTTNANAGGAAAPNTGAKSAPLLLVIMATLLGSSSLAYALASKRC